MKRKKVKKVKKRNWVSRSLALRSGSGQGPHHNRAYDLAKGRKRRYKHKPQLEETSTD